jgi:hypothetical protein
MTNHFGKNADCRCGEDQMCVKCSGAVPIDVVQAERDRIRAALPKIEDHFCAYNDGACRCECYGGLLAEVLDLLDNKETL